MEFTITVRAEFVLIQRQKEMNTQAMQTDAQSDIQADTHTHTHTITHTHTHTHRYMCVYAVQLKNKKQ